MRAPERYPLHSVRVDDEVWSKLKADKQSLNQLLREHYNLTGEPPEPPTQDAALANMRKQRKLRGSLEKPGGKKK